MTLNFEKERSSLLKNDSSQYTADVTAFEIKNRDSTPGISQMSPRVQESIMTTPLRSSKTYRKMDDKIAYYDINKRLEPEDEKYRTIDMNTSRFGDKERKMYSIQKKKNDQRIMQYEKDFERLSGSSRSQSPDGISDISAMSKFVYPKEHLRNLER